MSKFKSFASQGSFRDYQLQAPDEAAKIREETERTLRGKERAERFRQGNADLYLQAQKLAQQQEEMSRETNYRLETESRRLYKDSLDRDFRIQTENDQKRAEQQQNTFKQLSAFSQTATKMFVDFNTKITENQTNANTVNTLLAGTTFEQNLAIQGMIDNLTEAEFAQQGFIQQMVKEGKDVKALWTLYNNRNTRGFIENAGVIQNTSYSLAPYLSEVQKNFTPDLTPEQKRLKVETAYREWLANSFKDANGKQLNPQLVSTIGAPIFNQAYTQLMGEYDREEKKANLETLRQNRFDGYNTAWITQGGAEGIIKEFTTNPSKETRDSIADWIVLRLEAGTLTPEEATGILTKTYLGPNGKETSWKEQHPNDPNLGKVNEAIRKIKRNEVSDTLLDRQQNQLALDERLKGIYNDALQKGYFTSTDYKLMEQEAAAAGLPGYESPVLKEAYNQQDHIRNDAAAIEVFTNEYNNGTLSVEKVQMTKGISAKVKNQFLSLAQQYETGWKKSDQRSTYKSQLDDLLSNDPRILNKKDWTVQQMQINFAQKLDKKIRELGVENAPAAFQAVFAEAQAVMKNQGSITNGQFTTILKNQSVQQKQASLVIQRKKDVNEAFLNPNFRKDPTILANALGAGFLYQAYEDVKAGKPIPAEFKQIAGKLGMTPLEVLNWAVRPAKLAPITVSGYDAQILKNRPPIVRMFPTTNTIERANYRQNNSLSTAPRRGAFNVVQYVANDPRFKNRTFGPIVYDEHGHGGANMHVHYEFATKEEALAAKALFESKGYRISSFIRPQDKRSAHSKGFALDVAPPLSLPYNEKDELEWIMGANAVIGYNPLRVN